MEERPVFLSGGGYFAFSSSSMLPRMLPLVSLPYASQPTPGMAIFGWAISPDNLSFSILKYFVNI